MDKEQYMKIRNAGRALSEKLMAKGVKDNTEFVAKKLGFWDHKNNTLVMDMNRDTDVFAEYLIYQPNKKGNIVLDDFYESDVELSDLEEDFLEAMVDSFASLFTIEEVDPVNATMVIKDELDKDLKKYTLMDINFSQTAKVGFLMYGRLLPFEDIFMSSGLTFIYYAQYKDKMMNNLSSLRFKKRRKLTDSDMFILCHKKYNEYGIATETRTSYK